MMDNPPSSSVPFPPPQTFDYVPLLHALLRRLLSTHPPATATTTGIASAPAGGPPNNNHHITNPTTTANANNTNSRSTLPQAAHPPSHIQQPSSVAPIPTSLLPTTAAHTTPLLPPLDVKDLPTAVGPIKIRIQKARAVVESLPDIRRSVADQEREIVALQARTARLRHVLLEFGNRAAEGVPGAGKGATEGMDLDSRSSRVGPVK